MTVTVQQVLDRFADGLAEADFAAALESDLVRQPRAGAVTLTGAERDFLLADGVAPQDLEPVGPASAVRRAADDLIDQAATSITVEEAADRLGVHPSRVRHRVADRSLYGFRLGTRLRLPRWQFTDSGPAKALPGLRTVLAAVPAEMAPVELSTFITTAQQDLRVAGTPVTPRAWLLAGQPTETICQILQNFYQW